MLLWLWLWMEVKLWVWCFVYAPDFGNIPLFLVSASLYSVKLNRVVLMFGREREALSLVNNDK